MSQKHFSNVQFDEENLDNQVYKNIVKEKCDLCELEFSDVTDLDHSEVIDDIKNNENRDDDLILIDACIEKEDYEGTDYVNVEDNDYEEDHGENVLKNESGKIPVPDHQGNNHVQSWIEALKTNFDTDVVSTWSKRTQEAWVNNMKFSEHDAKEVREIRSEIISSLVDQLFKFMELSVSPQEHREILKNVHQVKYPWMFGKGPFSMVSIRGLRSGMNLGGLHGNKILSPRVRQSLYRKQVAAGLRKGVKKRRKWEDNGTGEWVLEDIKIDQSPSNF